MIINVVTEEYVVDFIAAVVQVHMSDFIIVVSYWLCQYEVFIQFW